MKGEDEKWGVGHAGAAHPIKEVDVNDVKAQHQDIDLLLRSDVKKILAENELEDVVTRTHPPRVMVGSKPRCHLQNWHEAGEELRTGEDKRFFHSQCQNG